VSVRSAALRLLVAFVGAQLASLYSVQAFVQHAHACYRCATAGLGCSVSGSLKACVSCVLRS
jgi:hypothetical protein